VSGDFSSVLAISSVSESVVLFTLTVISNDQLCVIWCRKCLCAADRSLSDDWCRAWTGSEGFDQSSSCDLCCSSVSQDSLFFAALPRPTLFCWMDQTSSEHAGNSHWVLTAWSVQGNQCLGPRNCSIDSIHFLAGWQNRRWIQTLVSFALY